jgi:hypothetical protein
MVKTPFLVWEKVRRTNTTGWSNWASLDERQRAQFVSMSEPGEPNFNVHQNSPE